MGNNKKKAEQLGIPFGTACNRLRKAILFEFAGRLKLLTCYRCSQPIEDVKQFSIEHKIAWFGEDNDLFWNMENIAFSHLSCNCRHGRAQGNGNPRKEAPDGKSKCSSCGKVKAIEAFYARKARWSGVTHQCKLCEGERKKKAYHSKKTAGSLRTNN